MKKMLIALLGLISFIALAFVITQNTQKEPTQEETDTGFTRFQTEELMREIGYVQ